MTGVLPLRRPSGARPWPFFLVDGEEKSGKTRALHQLAANGGGWEVFLLSCGAGDPDEHAVPGSDLWVVEHNGTFGNVLMLAKEVVELAAADPDRPVVLAVDGGDTLWNLLRDRLHGQARSTKAARDAAASDPFAPFDVANHLWEEARRDWQALLHLLLTFPGVGIMTSRTIERADGTRALEVDRSTPGMATAWVRFTRGAAPRLIGASAAEPCDLDPDDPLGNLLAVVGGDGCFAETRRVRPSLGHVAKKARADLAGELRRLGFADAPARATAAQIWEAAGHRGEITHAEHAALLDAARKAAADAAAGPPPDQPTAAQMQENDHAA